METRTICRAMLRNKTGSILVALQIALTLAVLSNALFIIIQRVEKIDRPTGMDSANTVFIQSYGFGPNYDQWLTVRRDLELLRRVPGVLAVSITSGIPLSGGGSRGIFGVTADPGRSSIDANLYQMDEHGPEAFGVTLLEGRTFNAAEVKYSPDQANSEFVPAVIITRDLARAFFGDQSALGRNIYDVLGQSAVVVGVMDNMLGAWVGWDKLTHVMFQPRVPSGRLARYVIRTKPGMRDTLAVQLEKELAEADTARAITWVRPHTDFTKRSYRADSRMVSFLTVIILLMTAVTALGVIGLASFQVNVRSKQIGTQRAVGARRSDIIRYFMVENWLMTSAGLLLGTLLAVGFGYWLSSVYALPRLQPVYVLGGMLLLWVLGQVSVFVPARRAASIPPSVATRSI